MTHESIPQNNESEQPPIYNATVTGRLGRVGIQVGELNVIIGNGGPAVVSMKGKRGPIKGSLPDAQ